MAAGSIGHQLAKKLARNGVRQVRNIAQGTMWEAAHTNIFETTNTGGAINNLATWGNDSRPTHYLPVQFDTVR